MTGFLHTLRRCQRGAAAVEFGLIAPVVLLVLVGTVEAGRAVWTRNSLQFAAEEAARFSMVNRFADDAEIRSQALDRLPGIDPAGVEVVVVRETVNGTDFVRVELGIGFDWAAPLIPGGPMRLTGSSRVPLLE